MVEKTGRFQVPHIVDEITAIEMYESAEFVQYSESFYTYTVSKGVKQRPSIVL